VELTTAARGLPAALAMLVLHVLGAMPADGQSRLDAAGVHACTSMERLSVELRSRTLPVDQARQRLRILYDIARTSSNPSLRHIANAQMGQLAAADDSLLLVMAEQFRAMCR
jgi:hypothetical protein